MNRPPPSRLNHVALVFGRPNIRRFISDTVHPADDDDTFSGPRAPTITIRDNPKRVRSNRLPAFSLDIYTHYCRNADTAPCLNVRESRLARRVNGGYLFL